MKTKLISVTALFAAFVIVIPIILFFYQRSGGLADTGALVVDLNGIEQHTIAAVSEKDTGQLAAIEGEIHALLNKVRQSNTPNPNCGNPVVIYVICGACLLFLLLVFGYVYFAILKPFDKLKYFAEQVARGEFDLPLNYERSNYFGQFTWAFDHMRREITKARSCEREAIDNNKTVIATLSHDIKTPISSIKAYAEGLEANLGGTMEKRAKYLNVIIRKCDEVSKLTNDLFLHSLSDLDKLKINPESFEICGFLYEAIAEISAEQGDVFFYRPAFEAVVFADKNRLVQIAENLINNSRKYAKTRIDVSMQLDGGDVHICFRDYGSGIYDEDMPFIFDKFYRGRNCGKEQGSGLGLYIVKYIAEQMNGRIMLCNHGDGLEAVLKIPVQKS